MICEMPGDSNREQIRCRRPCRRRRRRRIASSASTSCWLRMPPATMSWRPCEFAQPRSDVRSGSPASGPRRHVRVEEGGHIGLELRNGLVGRKRDLRLPSLDGDAAVLGVDAGDDTLRTNGISKAAAKSILTVPCSENKRRADDDALRTRIEHLARALDGANAAADLARQPLAICATNAELSP